MLGRLDAWMFGKIQNQLPRLKRRAYHCIHPSPVRQRDGWSDARKDGSKDKDKTNIENSKLENWKDRKKQKNRNKTGFGCIFSERAALTH